MASQPPKKEATSPKLRRPWEGPYVVVERLNDVVYRIQPGPQKKPKVVHRDRLWKYSGVEHADWFQVPVQDKNEDVSSRTTTQQKSQEVNTKGRASVRFPTRRQKYLPDSERTLRTRKHVTRCQGNSRNRRASGNPAESGEISLGTATMK